MTPDKDKEIQANDLEVKANTFNQAATNYFKKGLHTEAEEAQNQADEMFKAAENLRNGFDIE